MLIQLSQPCAECLFHPQYSSDFFLFHISTPEEKKKKKKYTCLICHLWDKYTSGYYRIIEVMLHGTESWNHSGWKRPLKPSGPTVSPTPPYPPTTSLSATSTQCFNTSRNGDRTIFLGNLCHCLIPLLEKYFKVYFLKIAC